MRGVYSLLIVLFLLSATVSAQANFAFESSDCNFPIPAGHTIDCGTLVVPEDYSHPANRQVRIAVAILRHPDGNPESDPIFYLEGGPGGTSLRFLHLIFPLRYEPLFAANRDIIVFDQRGVGLSEPKLDCNDFEELKIDHLDLMEADETISRRESEARLRDSLIACGRSLALDYDLSMVNSAVNARDIESLRQALGYDQINLWGISYGTRLALTTMRDYPEHIRSVVLDSTYPLESNIFTETPANWIRALDTLFASCESDSACNTSFPDLKTTFYETVDALNENPVRVTSYNPFTGDRIHDVVLDGAYFFELTIQLLYDTSLIPNLPQMISRVSEGDTSAYAYAIGRIFVQNAVFSYGMHYAVQCQEEMPFTDRAEIEAKYAEQPDLQPLVDMGVTGIADAELCQRFNAGSPLSIANDPVLSDIPTIIFGGHFDPVTPPAWGLQVHKNLSNSTFYEIPTGGHGTTADQHCPQHIAASFFINPTEAVNVDCLSDMRLRFNGTLEEQDFVPVLLSDYGMMAITIIPSTWQEHDRIAGLFLRNDNPFDVTLLQFSTVEAMTDFEALRVSVVTNFDLGLSTYVEQVDTDFIEWRLYRISSRGNIGFAAISIHENTGYVVLLLGTDHEKNRVLIPVLQGFTNVQ